MKDSFSLVRKFRIWTNRRGQDLIESALLAGFVVVAAGAIVPSVANDIGQLLGKISSMMPWMVPHGSVK